MMTCIHMKHYSILHQALPPPEAPLIAAVAQGFLRPLPTQLMFEHFLKMILEAAKVCVATVKSQGLVSSPHPEPLFS